MTEVQWYRPWPPGETVRWSLRNNTNYMQAAVLEGLSYAARHREELLGNTWAKAQRALEKGRSEAPYAWVFPPGQRDPARLAHLVNRLRAHRIEVHRSTAAAKWGGTSFPAGSYVVRMDQPFRNAPERARIDLAHARIDHREDRRFVVGHLHRERRERGHRHQRPVERERKALRGGHGEAHAGERAGPDADRDRIERMPPDACFREHLLAHRQQQFGMATRC